MISESSSESAGKPEYDPIFLHSRREAIFIFCVWLAALLWAVPYCGLNGYAGTAASDDLAILWGMPRWVVFGIVAPWLAADVITIVFCFVIMRDDDLGTAPEELERASAADSIGGADHREADV